MQAANNMGVHKVLQQGIECRDLFIRVKSWLVIDHALLDPAEKFYSRVLLSFELNL